MMNIEPLIKNLRGLYTKPEEIQVRRFVAEYTHPVANDNFGLYLFARDLESTLDANFLSPKPIYLGISEPYQNGSGLRADVCYFQMHPTFRFEVPKIARKFGIKKLVVRQPDQFLVGIGYEKSEKIK